MARIRLIHWHGVEGRERRARLASFGCQAEFDDLEGTALLRAVRATSPDACVIDLSRLPSHGREVAMTLRRSRATRDIPLVFVGGDPAKVAALQTLLPDATYTSWGRLKAALPRALRRPPSRPIVPPESVYAGKPVATKLGIQPGMRVSLLGAPAGIADTLAPLPPEVTLTAKVGPGCDLFLGFVRSRRELTTHLDAVGRDVTRQPVWCIWPKIASGVRSDLNGNVVREAGLAAGWVDYKVCSIDDTWSALAFKRRAR